MQLYSELMAICERLDHEGIDYAVCGGLALAVHGHPRFTRDIDVLARAVDVPRILTVAASLGYAFSSHPMTFQNGTPQEIRVHRVVKVVGSDYLPLDVIAGGTVLEMILATRLRAEHDGHAIPIVSKAGLIAMKRIADRDQDRLDIQILETTDA